MSRPKQGFTLIEILVVVIIIAITASIAMMVLGDLGKARRIESVAKQLAMEIPAAERQALLQPSVMGFALEDDGYVFYRFIEKSGWKRITDDPIFSFKKTPSNIQLKLIIKNKIALATSSEEKSSPSLIILPAGTMTPFVLDIGETGSPPSFQLIGQANGKVTLKKTAK